MASPELAPPAFGDPVEDQDQDESLEARIPDCNIAPTQEGVQARNPIQSLEREDDLPGFNRKTKGSTFKTKEESLWWARKKEKCICNSKTGGSTRKKKNKLAL